MAKLKILPEQYYDLTMAETIALWEGENERELLALRQTRRIAGLLRNAHFEKPLPEWQFMPLPGDEDHRGNPEESSADRAKESFYMLAAMMGGEITEEPSELAEA